MPSKKGLVVCWYFWKIFRRKHEGSQFYSDAKQALPYTMRVLSKCCRILSVNPRSIYRTSQSSWWALLIPCYVLQVRSQGDQKMEWDPALTALNWTGRPSGPGPFVLLGVPGLATLHAWLSVPMFLLYMAALTGNVLLLGLVAADQALRSPMYQLLGLLAAADLVLATSTVPKALAVLWGLSGEISFGACLTQLFVAHVAFIVESSVLLAMAVDRYVAICQPLRYAALLTQRVVGTVAVAAVTRGACVMAPPVVLLQRLPYCGRRALPHTYCEHMGVARLACGDIRLNIWYGLATTLLSPVLDLGLIGTSYALILRAVCQLPSHGARRKALGTCVAHASVIILFYTPALFSFLTHRFGQHTVPGHVHILLANLYVLVPPALNPVVYGVRTRQIAQRLRHLLRLCWAGAVRNVGPVGINPHE